MTDAVTPERSMPTRAWLRQRRHLLAPLLALALVAALYGLSLQTDIGASNDPSPAAAGIVGPLMDDSGEFVVAWHTWGVAHPPGYPLLNLTANLLTRLYGLSGVSPAAAASLVSFTFALLALAVLGWPLVAAPQRDDWRLGAAAAVLLPAAGQLLWLYASVAEVYTFALALGFGSLLLALRLGARPQARTLRWLGLLYGLALGHHRTLLFVAPALAVAAWPAWRLGWRAWLSAAALAVASLGVYLYLPLVALAGSPWVYGRSPLTLPGLLDALLAREYLGQLPVEQALGPGALLWGRLRYLALEMTWPALALGLAGLLLALSRAATRRLGLVFGLAFAGYLLAPVSQELLIGTHLPIMWASLSLAAAWGASLTLMPAPLRWGQLALTLGALLFALTRNAGQVLPYAHDPLGRQIIAAVAALDEPEPTVVEAWGPRYFALAYGKWATRELAAMRLHDVRGDLAGLDALPAAPDVLYTTSDMLYLAGPELWAEHLGAPVALESAGDGLVALRRAPRLAAGEPLAFAPGEAAVALEAARAWRAPNGDVRLAVTWRALAAPPANYNVFVHLLGRSADGAAGQLLAQGDRQHPVYGFAPTSRWVVGQRVRDDYRLPLPAGAQPEEIRLGLYLVDASGGFANLADWALAVEPAP